MFVAWQVWERVVRTPWSVPLGPSAHIRCYPHSTSSSHVIYCRLPDWTEMNFVLDFLGAGDLFLDVGANAGAYTLLAASVEGVSVIAAEPSEMVWKRLVENIELNGYTEVVALRAAVAAEPGTLLLTRGMDTINRVVSAGEFHGETETVDGVTVNDVVADHGGGRAVALMKIDVEGQEAAVLTGALKVLSADGPALIIENNVPQEIDGVLGSLGYAYYTYDPARRALTPVEIDRTKVPNLIAIRDLEAATARLGRRR